MTSITMFFLNQNPFELRSNLVDYEVSTDIDLKELNRFRRILTWSNALSLTS